jgi:hypothetical protein
LNWIERFRLAQIGHAQDAFGACRSGVDEASKGERCGKGYARAQ